MYVSVLWFCVGPASRDLSGPSLFEQTAGQPSSHSSPNSGQFDPSLSEQPVDDVDHALDRLAHLEDCDLLNLEVTRWVAERITDEEHDKYLLKLLMLKDCDRRVAQRINFCRRLSNKPNKKTGQASRDLSGPSMFQRTAGSSILSSPSRRSSSDSESSILTLPSNNSSYHSGLGKEKDVSVAIARALGPHHDQAASLQALFNQRSLQAQKLGGPHFESVVSSEEEEQEDDDDSGFNEFF